MEEKISDKLMNKDVALFCDDVGLSMLLKIIPRLIIKCIVISSIRPLYIERLQNLAIVKRITLLVQPKYDSKGYKDFFKKFKSLNIDLIICNSYSMIIRKDILKNVKYNAVNVHCSLLPKNRGPNPIQWAIIKGETQTGVTIHYIDNGLDSGDIIAQEKIAIDPNDTWVTLLKKLQHAQVKLLKEELSQILMGKNIRTKQNEAYATKNTRLNALSPKINFKSMSDMDIFNLIRAQVIPLKGAYIQLGNKKRYFNRFILFDEIPKLRQKYGH